MLFLMVLVPLEAQQKWGKDPFRVQQGVEVGHLRKSNINTSLNVSTNDDFVNQENISEREKKFVEKLKLMGVWQSGHVRKALISGKIYEIGHKISTFNVRSIEKRQVVISDKNNNDYVLFLKPLSYQRSQIMNERSN